METKLTIKWQLCQLIAHLSEKEQAKTQEHAHAEEFLEAAMIPPSPPSQEKRAIENWIGTFSAKAGLLIQRIGPFDTNPRRTI